MGKEIARPTGGGPKIGSTLPAQKVLRKLCEISETHIPASTRLRSTSAYSGEAAQRLSWRCVATDPKQTVPVVRSTRLPAATKAGLLNER
jgi:hypothetical protein